MLYIRYILKIKPQVPFILDSSLIGYIPGSLQLLQLEIGLKIPGQQERRKKDQSLACSQKEYDKTKDSLKTQLSSKWGKK